MPASATGLTSLALEGALAGRPGRFEHQAQFQMLGRLPSARRVLTAHIRQAEGEIERLGLGADDRKKAIAAFEQGKGGTLAVDADLQRLSERSEGILRACWRMVWISGSVRPGESRRDPRLGQAMGLAEARCLPCSRRYRRRHASPASKKSIARRCSCSASPMTPTRHVQAGLSAAALAPSPRQERPAPGPPVGGLCRCPAHRRAACRLPGDQDAAGFR